MGSYFFKNKSYSNEITIYPPNHQNYFSKFYYKFTSYFIQNNIEDCDNDSLNDICDLNENNEIIFDEFQ